MTVVHSYRQPGTVLTDHRFSVPLDHARPDGERIELYGREVVATGKDPESLPWLLYLEGGPGFGARRFSGPCGTTGCCCWTSAAPAGPPR